MRKRLPRPSYANVVATLALFLALGGTAWAALGKNAVKTRNIAPSAVTGPKLKNGAVTGPKIARDAVTARKLGRQSVTARAIAPKAILPGAIGLGSILTEALADNSVRAPKIQNGNVTGPKIQANAVTTEKIAAGSITSGKFAADAVAPNSNLFDGLASTKVMKTDRFGRTRVASGTTADLATTANIATFIGNQGSLDFTCDAGALTFTFRNTNAGAANSVWTNLDGGPAVYTLVAPSGTVSVPSEAGSGDTDTGSIDWTVLTDDTLIKMTTVVQDTGPTCTWAVYYEEVTLGSP